MTPYMMMELLISEERIKHGKIASLLQRFR